MRSLRIIGLAIALGVACLLPAQVVVAQDPQDVAALQRAMQRATEQYQAKAYLESGKSFEEAVALAAKLPAEMVKESVMTAHYNAACSYALAGSQKDKALAQFSKAIAAGYDDWEHIGKDTDLDSIRGEAAFLEIIAKGKAAHAAGAKERKKKALAAAKKSLSESPLFAFEFALPSVKDAAKTLKLEDHRGKVVIVDIWGTWCPPCRKEIPHFIELQKRYKDKLVIIGLNKEGKEHGEADAAKVRAYMKAQGMNYDCALITEKVQGQVPDFRGYPTTLFLDKAGKVRRKVVGYHSLEVLEATVLALMELEGAATPEAKPEKGKLDGPF